MSNLEFNCDNSISLSEAIEIGEKYKHQQRLLSENPQLHICRGCDRLTTAIYCCGSCDRAFAGNYEIDENGAFGHTESCNTRHRSRSYRQPNKIPAPTPDKSVVRCFDLSREN